MTIKDVINYLYRFKSPILLIGDTTSLKGYVNTREIITLMNVGFDEVESIPREAKVNDILSLPKDDVKNSETFPILNLQNNSIDLISRKELFYFIDKDLSHLEIDFEILLRNLPLPIVITDRFNNIVWINLKFLELTDLNDEEIIGRNVNLLFQGEKKKTVIKGKEYTVVLSEIIVYDIKVKTFVFVPKT
ncbi:MAG: PAS domain-containing protein [Brevinematia bacterium]